MTTTTIKREAQAQGENAVIVVRSCVVAARIGDEPIDAATYGTHKIVARHWWVSPPAPYAQHPVAVTVTWREPRKRTSVLTRMVPGNLRYCTIERDGAVLYDSRKDVPVDMEYFARRRQEDMQDWMKRDDMHRQWLANDPSNVRRQEEQRRHDEDQARQRAVPIVLDYDPLND